MHDIWIISFFNHTAFDANPIWKPLKMASPQNSVLQTELRHISVARPIMSSIRARPHVESIEIYYILPAANRNGQ